MTNVHRIQRPTTAAAAKQKVAVRFNHALNTWEVYTFLTGAFDTSWRWFQVTKEIADWYLKDRKAHRMEDFQKPEDNDDNPI